MANHESLRFCFIFSVLVLAFASCCRASDEEKEVYIVYMGSLPGEYSVSSQHITLLQQVTGAANSLVRSYERSFNGFAAKLTKDEKQKLSDMEEVVSVFPDRTLKLHTTRSWDFIGLNQSSTRKTVAENGMIIGFIDSGIWPESDSFKDDGFGPPPKKWKGACKGGLNFTCNNKVIGARFYLTYDSARDAIGHGTHTASIAAGNNVANTSFHGYGEGTARGGVPSSRIAVYKACDEGECKSSSVLAAFDDAAADGVDIISISLGPPEPLLLEEDPIAVGSFHATVNGILTVNSAGNSYGYSRVTSVAPWLFSVGASTTDRNFIDKLVLGNGTTIIGKAMNTFTLNGTKFPLIYARDAVSPICSNAKILARSCVQGCLDEKVVKGKIVVCDQVPNEIASTPQNGYEGLLGAVEAGATGAIVEATLSLVNVSLVTPLPGVTLRPRQYEWLASYAESTKNPEAEILRTEEVRDSFAPQLAAFSGLGPNLVVPDTMKPDISAPGVDIIAAYPPLDSAWLAPGVETTQVKYNILSGTSMACPHVAAAAAYVKSFHPDWSPAAIKSAIMTTAWPMDRSRDRLSAFGFGSGHVNPVRAVNPGLVYELGKEDYLRILCNSNFSDNAVKLMSGDKDPHCRPDNDTPYSRDLNYPSMAAEVYPKGPINVTFHRNVTNVGFANSTYKASISSDRGLTVKVEPEVLSFKSLKEKKAFVVTVTAPSEPDSPLAYATLTWSDGTHSVTSPVIAYSALYPIGD